MRTRFYCGSNSRGRFIYDPQGRPVIRYWFVSFGRLGNTREYNAKFMRGGQAIICTHGGMTRSLLQFLNTGQFKNSWDKDELYEQEETVRKLEKIAAERMEK